MTTSLGIFYMEFSDAIKEGDGQRVLVTIFLVTFTRNI